MRTERAESSRFDPTPLSTIAEQQGFFHDVLHSLATISVLTAALELEPGLLPAACRRLDLLRGEIRSLQEMAQSVLHRDAAERPEAVALDEVVAATAAAFAEVENSEVTLNIKRVMVCARRSDIRRLVANLLQNAFAAADQRGAVFIEVDVTNDLALLRITDSGPGFGKLHREGTRWGLSVVRTIVERLSGELELGSAPGGGASVTVRLPRMSLRSSA